MKSKNFLYAIIMAFCLSIVSIIFAKTTYGADLGYRWYSSYATIKSSASGYNSYVLNTRTDYHNNTDMTMYIDSTDPDIEVVLVRGVSFRGLAMAYSAYGPCAFFSTGQLTGNCNTTNKKATAGTIYFRDGAVPTSEREWAVRHEVGHIFGMGHEPWGTCYSVMADCNISPLQTFDTNLMDDWY